MAFERNYPLKPNSKKRDGFEPARGVTMAEPRVDPETGGLVVVRQEGDRLVTYWHPRYDSRGTVLQDCVATWRKISDED